MSISEQVKKLREYGNKILFSPEARNIFKEAADTMEALSAKVENVERLINGGWIPCEDSKNIPKEKQLIWVSVEYKTGGTESIEGIFIDGQPCRMNGVGLGLIAKAWMPRYIPKPYDYTDELTYISKQVTDIIANNCDGCISDTDECMHCMRAFSDCYTSNKVNS